VRDTVSPNRHSGAPRFGVVVYVQPERRFGRIHAQNGQSLTFLFNEWSGPTDVPEVPTAVQFQTAPHPRESARLVARRIRPVQIDWLTATVISVGPTYGFLRLSDDGRSVYFDTQCAMPQDLRQGEAVRCMAVEGRDDETLFALAVDRADPLPESVTTLVAVPTDRTAVPMADTNRLQVGACTQRGTRPGKSVNDDSFLIYRLCDEKLWLLAVADGVSRPNPNGWWASDKCMELLWRTLPAYEARVLQPDRPELEILHDWINEIHEGFLRERRPGRAALADYLGATSTLTFAVVTSREIFYAHCGDTRIYLSDPSRGQKLVPVIAQEQIDSQKRKANELIGTIAALDRNWRPVVGRAVIPAGGLVLLCSDGVIGGDLSLEKFNCLPKFLGDPGELQERVSAAVAGVAALGETDDLTLIALQPGEV
jgi:serine/threonine protein phosphatase PrpC